MRNNSKKNKVLLLAFMFVGILLLIPNVAEISNKTEVAEDSETEILDEDQIEIPTKTGYSTSYDASGGNINLTLHQNIFNTTQISINNTFDDSNNSIFESCPSDSNFNSSFVNITFDNIYAYNVTRVIEDSWEDSDGYVTMITSFNVTANCYLLNISYHLYIASGQFPTMNMKVFTSVWSGSTSTPGTETIVGSYDPDWDGQGRWVNLQLDNPYFLNTSKTDNNTWFVGFTESTGTNVLKWRYNGESNGDNSEAYYFSGGWQPFAGDYGAKVHLAPVNNHPNPEDVGLRVNETLVNGYDTLNGSGYWNSTDEYSSSTGSLEFNITADWYNVSCDVTEVIINYTKVGLCANSEFNISGSGNQVIWNVTIPGSIDGFGVVDFQNKYVNFTIPSSWNLIQVFKGGTEKSNTTWDQGDGWQIVRAWEGENGIFWGLNASSNNYINQIKTLVGGSLESMVNITNNVDFQVNFGAAIAGDVNLTVYSPDYTINYTKVNNTTPESLINLGSWNIQDNATEYGEFIIQAFWNNDTEAGLLEVPLIILGETEVILSEPTQNQEFLEGSPPFNVTFCFNDTFSESPIDGATINYSIAGAAQEQTTQNNGTPGYYNITIDLSGIPTGDNNVTIYLNKSYYNNITFVYYFKKVASTTAISPYPITDTVIYKQNATFQVNYSTTTGTPLNDSIIELVDINPFTIWSYTRDAPAAPGNYTIKINTTGVDVGTYPVTFRIYSPGNQSQNIAINIKIIQATTEIMLESFNQTLVRWLGEELTIIFRLNDTDNEELVVNPTGVNTTVTKILPSPAGLWSDQGTIQHLGAGRYELKLSIAGYNSGNYTIRLNASLIPNYAYDEIDIEFYIRGNYSEVTLLSISSPGGAISPSGGRYITFIGSNININFNFSNAEGPINFTITPDTDNIKYRITYAKTALLNGTLSLTNLSGFTKIYDQNSRTHKGILGISGLSSGTYNITIEVEHPNFENASKMFVLFISGKYDVNASLVEPPTSVVAGSTFTLTVKVIYSGGSWIPLPGANVRYTLVINGEKVETSGYSITNGTGIVQFNITIPLDAINMSLSIDIDSSYNTVTNTLTFSTITVTPPPRGIPLDIIIYILIIAGVAVLGVVGYRKVVIPRKAKKREAVMEVATAFDDAVNLEHILVLYRDTGTCVFFKSFGAEEIDPELISGFLTAIQSFGKEIKYQQSLNEITYGEKMLLLSDGEYIRVALVLGKKGSVVLRRNITRFIKIFEGRFSHILPSWKGQLNIFASSDELIDQAFNTSIILPHEINTDSSKVKQVKSPLAKRLLKLANTLTSETDRKFFFIASLLNEATDKTGEEAAELFVAIKELRETEALMPIMIDKIAPTEVSEQEINIINQRISQIEGYSPEEKENLVEEISKLSPAEREAALTSLSTGETIVSAPVKAKEGAGVVSDSKSAKKELKDLEKKAKEQIKDEDFVKAVEIYQNAASMAETWGLSKESEALREKARATSISYYEHGIKVLVKDAENAVKASQYQEAIEKYTQASMLASEVFKLGVTEKQKEVREYQNKAKEYEKYI